MKCVIVSGGPSIEEVFPTLTPSITTITSTVSSSSLLSSTTQSHYSTNYHRTSHQNPLSSIENNHISNEKIWLPFQVTDLEGVIQVKKTQDFRYTFVCLKQSTKNEK
jgi:hypothetical protein